MYVWIMNSLIQYHLIQVFRQMLKLDIKPSGKTLMYFLKVLKSCDIGDTDIAFR